MGRRKTHKRHQHISDFLPWACKMTESITQDMRATLDTSHCSQHSRKLYISNTDPVFVSNYIQYSPSYYCLYYNFPWVESNAGGKIFWVQYLDPIPVEMSSDQTPSSCIGSRRCPRGLVGWPDRSGSPCCLVCVPAWGTHWRPSPSLSPSGEGRCSIWSPASLSRLRMGWEIAVRVTLMGQQDLSGQSCCSVFICDRQAGPPLTFFCLLKVWKLESALMSW